MQYVPVGASALKVSRLPACYPWWHRVLNATDRPDPAESPYLTEFQRYALPDA
ncbi:hypothetical protein ACFFS2_10225 [Streptomyces aurantiacus]|uniref:Uncharacterized protein n=1 Tax=Streptomyces aurantiacus TaxID=47760 RepID=A0A7G1NPV7_9ACTN|nr:hypothetical protein [Streptomyces aurantiacus]BCL25238.1 hypothetical protein GCM10017557_00970 [Streptomyces aurantiacus]